MSDKKWETVIEQSDQRTERLKVQSGYIYRTTMWDEDCDNSYISGSTTQSMVFVPNTPIRVKTA